MIDYERLAREFIEVRHQMAPVSEISRLMSPAYGEGFVLTYLSKASQSVNPKDLSEAMNVSTARTAVIINQLEAKKLVRRSVDSNNGKYTIIELLPEGRKQAEENRQILFDNAIGFLQALGEDAADFLRIQKKIADLYSNKYSK